MKLRPWQRAIICGIYDESQPLRRAFISFGRKNAKTTLSACLLLLHLAGPEARANSQLVSAAQSRDQAAVIFALAAKMVRQSPELMPYVAVRDTAKQLACTELGTLYRALSADASTAFGLSPAFIVHDELGQVRGPRSTLYEALEFATAAQAEPLSIVISTQAPNDNDLLSVLLDDAQAGHDPRVRVWLYSADPEADPFDVETIRAANPAFGDFQNEAEVLAMANDARRMPSREAEYRNQVLNQRVELTSPFVTRSVWEANGGAPTEDWSDATVFAALDLSATSDLTALVLVARIDGQMQVRPMFWLPGEGLTERARQDRAPYDLWARQEYLRTTPGKSIEYAYVAKWLADFCATTLVRKIAFDAWGFKHFRPWLVRAGWSDDEITARFEPFGQGYRDMTPALRVLERGPGAPPV
jgi:phage terminase large subunit-like protein